MKNKKLFILILLTMILSLTSCISTIGVDYVENENTTYSAIENDVTSVYNTVSKGCVGIYASSSTSAGTGSGVIYKKVDSTYYVVTNAHVVEDQTSYKITLGGVKYYSAKLVGYDTTNDIAVLTFNLDILDSNSQIYINKIDETIDIVTPGQSVIAIGCPLGLENYNSVTTGVVSLTTTEVIQHDAAINPGNSGGGLFNLAGRLIGLNNSKEVFTTGTINGSSTQMPVEGTGYAISMKVVKQCIKAIEAKGGAIERPLLGISVVAVNIYLNSTSSEITYLPNGREYGVIIKKIEDNSNAYAAELKIGDCLISIDDIDISTSTVISDNLHEKQTGDSIKLYYYRHSNNSYNTVTITLR